MSQNVKLAFLVFGALIVLMVSTAGADYIYSDVDTYTVVDVWGAVGATVEVPICFANDTLTVSALGFRLAYDSSKLTAIGVSTDETRLEDLNWFVLWSSRDVGEIKFVGTDLFCQNYLQPGAGPLVFVYFQIDSALVQGESAIRFEDDPTEIPPIQNAFSDSAASGNFVPIQVDGHVRLLTGDNRPPVLDPIAPKIVTKYDSLCFTVTANDPDLDVLHYRIDVSDLYGCDDWHAEIDEITGEFCFYAGQHFVPPRPHDMTFQIIFCVNDFSATAPESLQDCESVPFTVDEPPFTLEVKKIFAFPGQQHVKVPFFLSNPWDQVGAWEILVEYDPSAGTVVGAELCDWAEVDDEAHGGPDTVFYAPWHYDPSLRPEYFNYQLNADGHINWVRVVGFQNLDWPQPITPELPRDEQMLLFCLIFDVSPDWDGHNVVFNFRTKDCTDNTLTDSSGVELWGPHPQSPYPPSRPDWLLCSSDPFVMLLGGHGVGVQEVERGDVNCDGVPYSVADAMMFIGYLVYGVEALQEEAGEYYCGSWEAHCYAADIDDDGYCFTVADLISLIRIINGYQTPPGRLLCGAARTSLPEQVHGEVELVLESPVDIAAGLFVIEHDGDLSAELGTVNMTALFNDEDGRMTALVYSLEGEVIPAGQAVVMKLRGTSKVAFGGVALADPFGAAVPVETRLVPARYRLSQNYPNPFNPATEIRYELPKECHVRLEVYNTLGQVVSTVVDDDQTAGHHTIRWDGTDCSSGVYFYRMVAGRITLVRKMVLLK